MGNLRNKQNYTRSFWDWTFLNEAFYPTKIKVSDVDGITERNGKFLFIETKRPNEQLTIGQEILHQKLIETGNFCVLVIRGNPNEPTSYTLTTTKGETILYGPDKASLSHLASVVRKWFLWADNGQVLINNQKNVVVAGVA